MLFCPQITVKILGIDLLDGTELLRFAARSTIFLAPQLIVEINSEMEVNESMIDDPNKQLILRADIPDVGIRKTIRVQLADKCQDILESLGRRLHLENATSEYKLYKIQLNDFRANGENAASSVPMDLEKRLCDYGLDWKDHDLIVVGRIMAPNQPVYGYASAPTSPQMGGTRAISTSRSQQLAVQLQQQLRAHTASSKTADHELENELKDLVCVYLFMKIMHY